MRSSPAIYLGGVSVDKALVRTEAEAQISQATMKGILTGILAQLPPDRNSDDSIVDICSLGHSAPGRNALRSFGFREERPATESCHAPMFSRGFTLTELRKLKSRRPTDFDVTVY